MGTYSDRQGKKYLYSDRTRQQDLAHCQQARAATATCSMPASRKSMPGILPFDYRQHFVVSFSLRAFLHFTDLRAKLVPSRKFASYAT